MIFQFKDTRGIGWKDGQKSRPGLVGLGRCQESSWSGWHFMLRRRFSSQAMTKFVNRFED
jgi:hypothetical protein